MTWWNRPRFKDCDGIICDGSIRSGKTVSMTDGFILWSMSSFSGQNFAICGKTIESLRRNVITLMPQWLEGIFSIVERRSENKLIITSGTTQNTYYLFGGKDESSYTLVQGITLAGVLFDEVALMPRSFVEQAMARCSVAGSKFWFNCNPESPGHWFYTEWIKKAQERNILYLHFTMDDNLSLAPEIKARYEGMYTGVFYRRYILGLWVKAEGLVYPMFSRDVHIVKNIPERSPRHRYYVSVDYGTVNPFAAGLYDFSPTEQKAVMVKELYYKGGSNNRVDNEAYYKMLCDLILEDTYQRTAGTVHNFTRTTAQASQQRLITALDTAHMRVMSGATSYTQAVQETVASIVGEQTKVAYPTGHIDTIETAVLRAVRTGVAQASGNMAIQGMEDRNWDVVLVSAHIGARYGDGGENPSNHFWWQGKFYSRTGKTPDLPLFVESTGYGTGEGLCGWNCGHSFGPGDLRHNPYTQFDAEENKKAYDLSQKQRAMERRIRHTKEKLIGLRKAVDGAEDATVKAALEDKYTKAAKLLERQNLAYNAFCQENNRKRLADRIQVAKWTRDDARKSIAAVRSAKSK